LELNAFKGEDEDGNGWGEPQSSYASESLLVDHPTAQRKVSISCTAFAEGPPTCVWRFSDFDSWHFPA
jgi:hypothetical protein